MRKPISETYKQDSIYRDQQVLRFRKYICILMDFKRRIKSLCMTRSACQVSLLSTALKKTHTLFLLSIPRLEQRELVGVKLGSKLMIANFCNMFEVGY